MKFYKISWIYLTFSCSDSTDSGHSSDAARQPAATPPILSSVSTWVFTDHSWSRYKQIRMKALIIPLFTINCPKMTLDLHVVWTFSWKIWKLESSNCCWKVLTKVFDYLKRNGNFPTPINTLQCKQKLSNSSLSDTKFSKLTTFPTTQTSDLIWPGVKFWALSDRSGLKKIF